ncbi:hypothetical protein GGTG_08526 [Gaeumannomyces tritici R3-111a-1]|uniref:Potassium transport protein n=1 Tax=Gaeumannomyces tritici (strain R3-111a-1) TaxID=644352 RepID=J3P4U0_GAET3|nr:hypothetical protein GGTG_08526 [Gaeumannomyces tritici R3-111a-1]EJT74688.1 hypothetical protein GGTG_08526 [Gaeumannomyces tritici R3-111a-1]
MWRPSVNFISLHYLWILFCSFLAFPILSPYGNLAAVDVFFFGCSSSTESGLNTIDVKELKTYQQLFIYVIPIITNLCFVNVMVVVIRLYWFQKRMKTLKPVPPSASVDDTEAQAGETKAMVTSPDSDALPLVRSNHFVQPIANKDAAVGGEGIKLEPEPEPEPEPVPSQRVTSIKFDADTALPRRISTEDAVALRIPGPRERDSGHPIVKVATDGRSSASQLDEDQESIKPTSHASSAGPSRRRTFHTARRLSLTHSIEKTASSLLVLGPTPTIDRPRPSSLSTRPRVADLPQLSRQVTVGRNSNFYNLTERDREVLGGIEYRSLKLLLKIVSSYFIGLHLFGIICLLPWIHANAGSKYTDWLDQNGLDWSWWAIYSAQTMTDNLGFTLTPDSMVSFKDATWPILVMTFLAFAGNTCYPIFLRLIIFTMSKLVPKKSATKGHLQFLLDHPRRCYTLLFPSKPTWVLFGILVALNFVDVLLMIVLDLKNPAVTDLPIGPRILSALFQAASARHTGTATFNLSLVNPAVQFSLICMMYIAVFPIAISIRASNTDENHALGIYSGESNLNELSGVDYVTAHIRNQLSFDLWYIFLGTFCICIAESERIMDPKDPAFSVFPVFFEVVSAYGNVGLSLGHPTVNTSLCGQFTPFSKVVICAMMIRGRHRGLPNSIDRAIMLPGEDRPGEAPLSQYGGHSGRPAAKDQ